MYRGATRPAVENVSFSVSAGQTVAVVGESGAGKSTLARLVAGLERPTSGDILIEGQPVRVRPGEVSPIQMVFQDPFGALNPLMSIGASIGEPLRRLSRRERRIRVSEAMETVGLDPQRAGQRPRTFSGGQLQRAVLARALAASPRMLICDEPTASLDVSVQAQVVNLLLDLQRIQGFGCILVTHDLGVVRVLAHDVVVLRHGAMIEHQEVDRLFAAPEHEYTGQLLTAERPPAVVAT